MGRQAAPKSGAVTKRYSCGRCAAQGVSLKLNDRTRCVRSNWCDAAKKKKKVELVSLCVAKEVSIFFEDAGCGAKPAAAETHRAH